MSYRKPRLADSPAPAVVAKSATTRAPAIVAVLGLGCLVPVVLLLCGGVGVGVWFAIPAIAPKADAATYVYEKDTTAVPSPVRAALNKLNRDKKILATEFEQDTVTGNGETPKQYRVPLAAAKQAGLPALVVTGGDKVIRVVKDPRTEKQVLEAVP